MIFILYFSWSTTNFVGWWHPPPKKLHQWTQHQISLNHWLIGSRCLMKLLSFFLQSSVVPGTFWFRCVWRPIERISESPSLYLYRKTDVSIWWGRFQTGTITAQRGLARSVKRLPACKWDGDVFVQMVNRLQLVLCQQSCSWRRRKRRRKQQQRLSKQETVH